MLSEPLPASFPATRESLRALSCYVIAPARKARTGRIGLRPVEGGFGTPPFDDGTRIVVRDAELRREPDDGVAITTLRAAADFLDIALSPDPGVGHDLPPYEPDRRLEVDVAASRALAEWYRLGQAVIDGLDATVAGEAQLWPEHFDLAIVLDIGGAQVNVGFSPGDAFSDQPYAYVGPHDTAELREPFWNAPFGAYRTLGELAAAGPSPADGAAAFIAEGLGQLAQS